MPQFCVVEIIGRGFAFAGYYVR
ncbi:unnamed protein product [Spirodela intermedia]|uniref:Uncharacterized protein n=2 Tax=Spirodela intermedia TaxID=51605 RepID=A0A7I8KJZ6_SPIIN|nr:unnamed protein product [Spirodela intermedia]CAA6660960.1 unnamed protein product [Spirodela intermedia]CAA7397315.1 unnamed protein product [Spirodela intermedia]